MRGAQVSLVGLGEAGQGGAPPWLSGHPCGSTGRTAAACPSRTARSTARSSRASVKRAWGVSVCSRSDSKARRRERRRTFSAPSTPSTSLDRLRSRRAAMATFCRPSRPPSLRIFSSLTAGGDRVSTGSRKRLRTPQRDSAGPAHGRSGSAIDAPRRVTRGELVVVEDEVVRFARALPQPVDRLELFACVAQPYGSAPSLPAKGWHEGAMHR